MLVNRGSDMRSNGAPPQEAACLFEGKVMHHRMAPKEHRFSYSVFSLMIDIDRLDEAGRLSPLFAVDRGALLSFHEADHLEPGFENLRANIDWHLHEAGLKTRADKILLVCYPRVFGYVFNPISIYYAYDGKNRLTGMVYEVRNTFGGRHFYVCPVRAGELHEAGVSQMRAKAFHVSPFLDMDKQYLFRMLPPGRSIRWRILETDDDGPVLAATFSGEKLKLDTANLAGLMVRLPLLTLKIVAGIHFEAFRLWLKGIPFFGMTPHYPKRDTAPENLTDSTIADSGKTINVSDIAA